MLRQISRSPPPRVTPALALLAILLAAEPAVAEAPVSSVAPGATLEEVLAIARRLSPEDSMGMDYIPVYADEGQVPGTVTISP